MNSYQFASFNCKNVKRSVDSVRELCRTCDLIALQETWLLPEEITYLGTIDSDFGYTGTSAVDTSAGILRGRPFGGVALLWRSSVFQQVSVLRCNNARISALKVTTKDRPVLVMSIYMPTNCADNLPDFTDCLSARRRGRGGKRRNRNRSTTMQPEDDVKNRTSTEVPVARKGKDKHKRERNNAKAQQYDIYDPGQKDWESGYVEMPKDLYQAHLRPGVIFRIHMSEAVLKMQYRNYGEDKDESVIEADVEYLRLTRKVINDEITKFEDLQWLIGWFHNRSDLIQEHMCNTRYFAIGTPPTMFTHSEEYMKRLCLFDSVYIDHIPYVVGEDSSLMAGVAPPVLHCDAATCTSVPFIDSVMFDERLSRTNVRTLTRCQASCRAHCRNDPDCLKRCSDRCLRTD